MNRTSRRAFTARCGTLLALAALVAGARADEAQPGLGNDLEYQVKAVFLLRIAQFTDWPREAGSGPGEFVIGILGRDPFGDYLDQAVAGERIAGLPVVVRRFQRAEEAANCDLLFIADSHAAAAAAVLRRLSGSSTLTVADFDGFVGAGGAIELFVERGRVRLRVDRGAAESAGLTFRSQLLRVADRVE